MKNPDLIQIISIIILTIAAIASFIIMGVIVLAVTVVYLTINALVELLMLITEPFFKTSEI